MNKSIKKKHKAIADKFQHDPERGQLGIALYDVRRMLTNEEVDRWYFGSSNTIRRTVWDNITRGSIISRNHKGVAQEILNAGKVILAEQKQKIAEVVS